MLFLVVLYLFGWASGTPEQALKAIHQRSKLLSYFQEKQPVNINSILPENIMLPMRDGVKLYTNYWAIGEAVKKPTVMIRSPYGPDGTENIAYIYIVSGFAIVMQNDRGTGSSEGDFDVNQSNPEDFQDTIKWICQQPWSNGQVYEVGASADGMYAYLSLQIPQPNLYGQWLIFSNSLMYFTAFQGGMSYMQNLATEWLHIMQDWRPNAPSYLSTVVEHEGATDWWNAVMLRNLSNVNFPAVHLAGWYDIFLQPMIKSFENYNTLSSPGGHGKQKLIVGPRGHCMFFKGDWDIGWFPNDEYSFIWGYEESISLFSRFSSPEQQKLIQDHRTATLDTYTFYVMGASKILDIFTSDGNYWTTLPAWPKTTNYTFYLGSGNRLLTSPERTSGSYSYIYNPRDPTPTLGGNNLFLDCGPKDQTSNEKRSDNIIFTSEPFLEPTALIGNFTVELYVIMNTTDTDFAVRITDVYPEGDSILLTDYLFRMRWRNSWEKPEPVIPGTLYKITFDTWPIAYVWGKGHRLRLAITSSNSPRYGLNLNNGLLVHQVGPVLIANNTIRTGLSITNQSTLVFQTLPLSALPHNVL